MRLNKFLAHCGVASRRKCDELIFSGKVIVNNSIIKNPAYKVNISKDAVIVNGKKVKFESKIYIALYKPENVLSTVKDKFGRDIIIDIIKGIDERIYPVGRLDYDVEGLLILTNDGELTNRLIHPRYKVEKVYLAKVEGFFSNEKRIILEKGVVLDGKKTLPAKCKILSSGEKFSKIELTIREGRKRQVKKMFEAVGNKLIKLKRIKFGPISLGYLKKGEWRYLTKKEIRLLKNRFFPKMSG